MGELQRFSQTSEGSEPHIRLPCLEVLAWKMALKASGAYFQESQRTGGNRDSTLKGHIQNLTCSRTQGRSSNLKGVRVRPTC